MMRMQYKRRAQLKTNYRRRLRLLLGRKDRIVVRKSISGFSIQLVRYSESGDQTFVEVSTKHLREHGWKGHGGSIPSAYLTGFLFGKTAAKKGFGSGVIDFGQESVSQSLLAAALGARDAGIDVPVGAEVPEERIKGLHIAEYARKMKGSEPENYKKRFSAYLKNGLAPENIPEHFEEVKKTLEGL
ncbi:MAG: 50S ribosomal protein L18 [Candidatus Aenigmarchaeota archaeon]|nr:50S ribosomal protein L18 [Candidatus Aenigmarchaeota archaeon]